MHGSYYTIISFTLASSFICHKMENALSSYSEKVDHISNDLKNRKKGLYNSDSFPKKLVELKKYIENMMHDFSPLVVESNALSSLWRNNKKSDNISNRKGLPKFYFYKTPTSFPP